VIAGTPFSDRQLRDNPYASRWHPNYIASVRNADMDATIELFGHVRAENPGSEVRFYRADELRRDHLTGHLIILGGGDALTMLTESALAPVAWLVRRTELPVRTRVPPDGEEEYDSEFVVTIDEDGEPQIHGAKEEVYRPTFLRDETAPLRPRLLAPPELGEKGYPQLEYDVALLARQPNELNLSATLTICTGIFSRGTYGAVRALTDANLRARNEQYLYERFRDPESRSGLRRFWMLIQVPVFQGDTITPDLNRPFHRLRQSS